MADKDTLQRWWDGLTEQERAQAVRASDTGRATKDLLASLRDAGVIKGRDKDDSSIPDDVDIFLKARH